MTDSGQVLYILKPPVPDRAGFVDAEKRPFYFHCADCMRDGSSAKLGYHFAQPIAAVIAGPDWDRTFFSGVWLDRLGDGPCDYTPAIYCERHARERWPEAMPQHEEVIR